MNECINPGSYIASVSILTGAIIITNVTLYRLINFVYRDKKEDQ